MKENGLTEEVLREFYDVLAVLSIMKLRGSKFREELNFFEKNWKKASQDNRRLYFLGAYKRLEHEVMFLSIEAYSVHEGISKKKSLYSNVIKQNGELLTKVDKTPMDQSQFICAGIFDSDLKVRDSTIEENNAFIRTIDEMAYGDRKGTKEQVGITSPNHDQLDVWLGQIIDKDTILRLGQFRDRFAHRLNSLEKLKLELEFSINGQVLEMLDVIEEVVDAYFIRFQQIICYTTAKQVNGVKNFEYYSLSRLELANSLPRSLNSSHESFDKEAPID